MSSRSSDPVLDRLRARLRDVDVEALLADAEAEALAEVRRLLKDVFVQELLTRAAGASSAEVPPPDAPPMPQPEEAEASPAASVAEAPSSVAEAPAWTAALADASPSAPEPGPGRAEQLPAPHSDSEGLYLYGLVRAAVGLALPDLVGIGGAPVRVLFEGALGAVVSSAPLEAFDADALTARLEDPAWLDAYPYAHQRVQDVVLRHGALVPVRFGTLFHSEDALRGYLDAHDAALLEALAHLDGRAEWTLKVWADRDVLTAWVAQQGDEAAGAFPSEGASGTAYLLRKQRGRLLQDEVRRIESECAAALHAGLAVLAADAHSRAVHAREGTGPRLVAQHSYLIEDERLPGFEAEVKAASARFAEWGVTAEVSGPWPPYSFVGLPTA